MPRKLLDGSDRSAFLCSKNLDLRRMDGSGGPKKWRNLRGGSDSGVGEDKENELGMGAFVEAGVGILWACSCKGGDCGQPDP